MCFILLRAEGESIILALLHASAMNEKDSACVGRGVVVPIELSAVVKSQIRVCGT